MSDRPLTLARLVVPFAALVSLSACGGAEEQEPSQAVEIEDISGGELVVPDDAAEVPADLPETPMTPVPDAAASSPVPAPAVAP